jgi:hypothetical protein
VSDCELLAGVLEERVSSDPDIVVKEPFGSVDTDGGMLVTEKLCDAGDESVSIEPDIVVTEPFGSVDTDGGMLVTEKLCDAEADESVSIEPDIVVNEPFGPVDIVGGMLVIDRFAGIVLTELPDKLDPLKGFVFVPDMKVLDGVDTVEVWLGGNVELDGDIELDKDNELRVGVEFDADAADDDDKVEGEDGGVDEIPVGDVPFIVSITQASQSVRGSSPWLSQSQCWMLTGSHMDHKRTLRGSSGR